MINENIDDKKVYVNGHKSLLIQDMGVFVLSYWGNSSYSSFLGS